MDKPKRILLCRTGGIGDVIHTLPLVKLLRKEYPKASIEYLTAPNIKLMLDSCCAYIDKVWEYDKRNLDSTIKTIKGDSGIDYFINLHTGFKYFFVNLFKLRAKKFFQYKKLRHLHAVLNFAMTYKTDVKVDDLERENLFNVVGIENILREHGLEKNKYICFVPGVGKARPNRMWPLENWIGLSEKLYEKQKLKIVLLGGKEESDLISYFEEKMNNKIILIDKLSLIDTTRVIAGSKATVSCDTGLIHIASALSKDVVGLYGPTLALRTGPFNAASRVVSSPVCECRRSEYVEPKKCNENDTFGQCMKEIDVSAVEEKVLLSYNIPA